MTTSLLKKLKLQHLRASRYLEESNGLPQVEFTERLLTCKDEIKYAEAGLGAIYKSLGLSVEKIKQNIDALYMSGEFLDSEIERLEGDVE